MAVSPERSTDTYGGELVTIKYEILRREVRNRGSPHIAFLRIIKKIIKVVMRRDYDLDILVDCRVRILI